MEINLSVEQAIEQVRQGRQVILVDDEDRENEGDLCLAAEKVTPDHINFMARFGRGLICLSLSRARIDQLGLPPMSERNRSRFGTQFHVSIEAADGVTTGISAADRARTIAAAVGPGAGPHSVVTPGHVFPLCAHPGGVLARAGQTEGSVDLARLAGLEPAGVICEIMNDDGTMARRPDLEQFARTHGMGIVSVEQLIRHRIEREQQVDLVAEAQVRPAGLQAHFRLLSYRTSVGRAQYMALVLGDVATDSPVLVRMHRASLPTDIFGVGQGVDRSKTLVALRRIEQAGRGVFVYVLPDQIDLGGQVRRLSAGPAGHGSVETEGQLRDFGLGAQILRALGLTNIHLMTDNPRRIVALHGFGLHVARTVPLWTATPDA